MALPTEHIQALMELLDRWDQLAEGTLRRGDAIEDRPDFYYGVMMGIHLTRDDLSRALAEALGEPGLGPSTGGHASR